MTRVAVIGAGIAGLTAAEAVLRLGRERGLSPVVDIFEAGPRAGGCIRTIREDGYTVECGPGAIAGGSDAAKALFRSLQLESEWMPPAPAAKRRFVFARGRLHEAPSGPKSLLTFGAIPLMSRLRVLLEPLMADRSYREETVHDFMVRHFGQHAGALGAGLMVRGVLAGDPRAISLDAAYPRLREMEREHGSLFTALKRAGKSGRPLDLAMGSFRGGLDLLVQRLASRFEGHLHLNRAARSLHRDVGKTWRIEFDSGAPVVCDRIILSTPARQAADLLEEPSPEAAQSLRGIPCAGIAVVALAFGGDAFRTPPEGYGFLVAPGELIDVLGAVFESKVFPGRAPEGQVLMRCMLGGAGRDDVVARSDAALIEAATAALDRALGLRAAPLRSWVFRHPAAIPQYGLPHLGVLGRLDRAFRDLPELALAGNSYHGVSVGSLIEQADRVARSVAYPDPPVRRWESQYWRDASGRLTFEMHDLKPGLYDSMCERVAQRFGLTQQGSGFDWFDVMVREFLRGNQLIGLEWDNWCGFTVVAKTPDAEPLVNEIGAFLRPPPDVTSGAAEEPR